MDIRRFFCKNDVIDSIIEIDGEEAYHLRKVLKVKKGTQIEVTDGAGKLYWCIIDDFISDRVRVKVNKTRVFSDNSNKIILAPSLLKRNAMNLMIEKLSEIGISDITPVLFNRTELKPSDKVIQKWKKITISSLKVNKQVWLTKINPPLKFADLINEYSNIENKLMLDIEADSKLSNTQKNNTIVVIGPPGDFIKSEREILIESQYDRIKINSSILKVETAAISISAILKENDLFIGNT